MKDGSIWISECGRYVARYTGRGALDVTVYASDGSARWVHASVRHGETCPAPRLVVGFSNHGRTLRSGRYVTAFELDFVDVDMTIPIHAGKGNAVVASYNATFRRRLRWLPKVLRQQALTPPEPPPPPPR